MCGSYASSELPRLNYRAAGVRVAWPMHHMSDLRRALAEPVPPPEGRTAEPHGGPHWQPPPPQPANTTTAIAIRNGSPPAAPGVGAGYQSTAGQKTAAAYSLNRKQDDALKTAHSGCPGARFIAASEVPVIWHRKVMPPQSSATS